MILETTIRRLLGRQPKPCDHRAARGVRPNVVQHWVSEDGTTASGSAGPVTCPTCGAQVGPFDDNYPTIHPTLSGMR